MDAIARIGPSIHIKGDITASEPLTIDGRVEGTIDVAAHVVTLAEGGRLDAIVTAHTIVIGGAVHGSLAAGARIVVRETASIDGDLSAPAVSVAAGATVQGRVNADGRRASAAADLGPALTAA
jgi:cytoskeletal protein CcmA (bactofilin family)